MHTTLDIPGVFGRAKRWLHETAEYYGRLFGEGSEPAGLDTDAGLEITTDLESIFLAEYVPLGPQVRAAAFNAYTEMHRAMYGDDGYDKAEAEEQGDELDGAVEALAAWSAEPQPTLVQLVEAYGDACFAAGCAPAEDEEAVRTAVTQIAQPKAALLAALASRNRAPAAMGPDELEDDIAWIERSAEFSERYRDHEEQQKIARRCRRIAAALRAGAAPPAASPAPQGDAGEQVAGALEFEAGIEERAGRTATRIRHDGERVKVLERMEEAAYGVYSVLCLNGSITADDPAVLRMAAAFDGVWADELADASADPGIADGAAPQQEGRGPGYCGNCWRCLDGVMLDDTTIRVTSSRMIVCPDCGNKRCPKASDHRNACTGSNDPGQPGSVFGGIPSPSPQQDGRGRARCENGFHFTLSGPAGPNFCSTCGQSWKFVPPSARH